MIQDSKVIQRLNSSSRPSVAAENEPGVALHEVSVLRLMGYIVLLQRARNSRAMRMLRCVGYIVFLALLFVGSGALGVGIAMALNWWEGWPELLCTDIQGCYELLF
jgi:hypothetical protein